MESIYDGENVYMIFEYTLFPIPGWNCIMKCGSART